MIPKQLNGSASLKTWAESMQRPTKDESFQSSPGTSEKNELLLGCGNSREKKIGFEGTAWSRLTTLDMDPRCNPDVVHDLETLPLPFADNSFDEIHAYDVLEHVGRQGDWRFFFDQFMDFYRVLKPDGLFFGITPKFDSPWAWGDPGHTRIIGVEHLIYLMRSQYAAQVGKGTMTDYRWYYRGDFTCVFLQETDDKVLFGLQAIKPARSDNA